VCVWKLYEEKTCEEYQNIIKDKIVESEWKYFDVNKHFSVAGLPRLSWKIGL